MKTIKIHPCFIFLFIYCFFLSCRPEQETTDFNTLIEAPSGRDMAMHTDEDEDLLVEYRIDPLKESIELRLLVAEQPKFGKLKNCIQSSLFSIQCVYTPNRNFNGEDTIHFIAKDGDVLSEEKSIVKIEVYGVPDAPIAIDGSLKAKSAKLQEFNFPQPIDPDGVTNNMRFEIVKGPRSGLITKCHSNKCSYTSNTLFEGSDQIIYQVIDDTNLTSNQAIMNIEVSLKKDSGIETFTQGVSNLSGVDIVWVIDNSGSMKDEQETLASNFQSFIDNFMDGGKAKFPFNMGVITTDAYANPKSNLLMKDRFGVPFNLSSIRAESDFLNFKTDFEAAVNVGIDGSASERCFDSMEQFQIKNNTWFGGDEKMLVYIIMTDEKEQSTKSVSEWARFFTNQKNEIHKVKIYPIIKFANDDGQRFFDIANLTGTKLYDVDSSFHEILDNISLSVSQNLSTFELRSDISIITSSIKVSVDGKTITNFKYINNTIHLESAPSAYSTIVVRYSYGGK